MIKILSKTYVQQTIINKLINWIVLKTTWHVPSTGQRDNGKVKDQTDPSLYHTSRRSVGEEKIHADGQTDRHRHTNHGSKYKVK